MRNIIFTLTFLLSTISYSQATESEKNGINQQTTIDSQINLSKIKKNIQISLPSLPIDSLKRTPIKGLYELISVGSLVYITEDAKYYLSGQLIDIKNKVNLTSRAKNVIRLKLLKTMSIDDMLVYPAKGEKKRHISVFTDTSCPFCVKLHEQLPELLENGIEVRYMLYPRAGVGSQAYKTMVNVWCADNKQQALTNAKKGEILQDRDCETPIIKHLALGRKMGLEGTPMIIFDDGSLISGFRPAKVLIEQMN